MYRLEYCTGGDWHVWQDGIEDRGEVIDLLYSAQIADIRDNMERVWRISPNPWEVAQ